MKKIDYQALFQQISQAENEKAKQKALTQLHEIIYTFPMKRYQFTSDVAGDFYLYCVNKIPLFLQEYQKISNKIPFSAFLAVRLHFLLRKFLRRRKRPRSGRDEPLSWDDILTLEVTTVAKSKTKKKVHFLLSKLNKEEVLTIKLYYGFYLSLSDLRYLNQIHKSLKKTFTYYRTYLQEVNKLQQEIQKEQEKLERYLLEFEKKFLLNESIHSLNEVKALKEKKLLEILETKGKVKLKTVALLMAEHQSTTKRRLLMATKKLMGEKFSLK